LAEFDRSEAVLREKLESRGLPAVFVAGRVFVNFQHGAPYIPDRPEDVLVFEREEPQ
jgi:hypothetical protein